MLNTMNTRFVLFMVIFCLFLGACEPYQAADDQHDIPALPEQGEPTNADLFGTGDPVQTTDVEYISGVVGFLAEPIEQGAFPGVVMIHEWWGLNDNIKNMAKHLAAQGYRVLAVDLYNGNVATTADDARKFVNALDQEQANVNMNAAADFLQSKGSSTLASLGWCFGGKQSLQLSLTRPLDATVIYYGHLETDSEILKQLNGPVLGVFGAEDQSITVAAVNAFDDALTDADKVHDITIYEGVGHAFANPSGSNFAANETKDAWDKTLKFLERSLKEK